MINKFDFESWRAVYHYSSPEILIDITWSKYQGSWKDYPWYTWPLKLQIQEIVGDFELDQNLLSLFETRLEEYGLAVFYKTAHIKNKKLLFILLRYYELLQNVPRYIFEYSFKEIEIFDDEIREQVWYFLSANSNFPDVKEYIKFLKTLNEKDKFDSSFLDFLEGQIDSQKKINWGVGQVMKKYPNKFSPKEIKEAIEKRWQI